MTQEIFYQTLRQRFCKLLEQHDLMQDAVEVICRALASVRHDGRTFLSLRERT